VTYLAELKQIFGAIAVQSPTSFSCAGKTIETEAAKLLSSLEDFLYGQCYITRFQGTLAERTHEHDRSGDLTKELQEANRGRACRDSGWSVEQALEAGDVLARKAGAVRRFEAGHYLLLDAAFGRPKEGQRLAICFPRDSTTTQDQFYFVFGETVSEHEETYNQIRFYWNLAADGAAPLMQLATTKLNRFQVPFQLKCVNHRERLYRRDSAVLYVDRRHYTIAAMLVAEVHDKIRDRLLDDTPLFTKRLARGLALAEDPGDSFGKSRCKIVAQALWAAYESNLDPLEELTRLFRERGLTLERPYLNPGSVDRYEFPVAVTTAHE
jgi:hypothetical protein